VMSLYCADGFYLGILLLLFFVSCPTDTNWYHLISKLPPLFFFLTLASYSHHPFSLFLNPKYLRLCTLLPVKGRPPTTILADGEKGVMGQSIVDATCQAAISFPFYFILPCYGYACISIHPISFFLFFFPFSSI
jgi:hypothetical protein